MPSPGEWEVSAGWGATWALFQLVYPQSRVLWLQCPPAVLSSTKLLDSWDYHRTISDVPFSGSPNSNAPSHSRAIFCPGDTQVQGEEVHSGGCENFPSL